MSGITDMPVNVCKYCGATWIGDEQMYDETERCPHCGRYPTAKVYDEEDAFSFIGEGSSQARQIIYSETGGPILQEDANWIVTEQRL